MKINACDYADFRDLNRAVNESSDDTVVIDGCVGQRYIGCGVRGKEIRITGTPGNALGAYLDGGTVRLTGNAQDATGDTMNDGKILIDGNSGDAAGYAMRGGEIYIKGNAGYRAGIHMKAYKEKVPVLVIGGKAGSFLGEYQAGGIIIVLGIGSDKTPVGNFCGTGMHGGKIFLRCKRLPHDLPRQVKAKRASGEDMKEIEGILAEFCKEFSIDKKALENEHFYLLTPDSANPYKQLYVTN